MSAPWTNSVLPSISTTVPNVVYIKPEPTAEDMERAVQHVQDFAAKQGGLNVESCANAGRIRDIVREAVWIALGHVVLTPEQVARIKELRAEGRKTLPGRPLPKDPA